MVAIFQERNQLIKDVPVDIKTGEFHSSSASVPAQAVMAGSYRNDHIIINPDSLTVTFEMSNADDLFGFSGQRASTMMANLLGKLKKREIYDVLTTHKLYKNMVIQDVSTENVGTFNGMLVGSVVFTEYNEVELSTVTVNSKQVNSGASGSTEKTAASKTESGKVEAEPLSANQESSLLSQVFG